MSNTSKIKRLFNCQQEVDDVNTISNVTNIKIMNKDNLSNQFE